MFPLTDPVNGPKGTLSALLGVRIARTRDLVGLHQGKRRGTLLCQSCWELGTSSVLSSSFLSRVFCLEAKRYMPGGLYYLSAANSASGLDKSFENLCFGCIQLSRVEALSCFLGNSSMASCSQSLVFLLRPYVTPNVTIFSQIRPVETCWSPYNNLFISFVT